MTDDPERITLGDVAETQRVLGSKAALDLLNAAAMQAELRRTRRDVLSANQMLLARYGPATVCAILQLAEHDPEVCTGCWSLAERCELYRERGARACCPDCSHSSPTAVDTGQ